MSKGILNNRDKFVWDNTHKPDISDVVPVIDDEMDDLLDDHDDKIVDIVGDNMNDLLDAHDDKVVSIVGDNMSTLLSSNAAAIRLISGDLSGITTTPAKVGTWDATHDIYAFRKSGEVGEITSSTNISLGTVTAVDLPLYVTGNITKPSGHSLIPNTYISATEFNNVFYTASTNNYILQIGTYFSGGTYDVIVYFIRAITPTP